ncbi:hypothetical protein DFJ73DRAFT_620204 [Zopfochytrium polystomum]|nr:hypothetical protein DFJ73DRAFT_620204 [Zopfochytrium polystomum]
MKPPGEIASAAEKEWESRPELKELYGKKTFLVAGLYSNYYKSDEQHGTASVLSKGKNPARSEIAPFTFAAPQHYSATRLETEEDFQLPYDVWRSEVLRVESGVSRLDVLAVKRKPSSFVKISRNIFVDRKPNKPDNTPICQCSSEEGGCDSRCLNRCMLIECEPQSCPCGDLCSNQAFQRQKDDANLTVFWAKSRGYGLRTETMIPRDKLIIEYRGEIISFKTCMDRMVSDYANQDRFYFFNYGRHEVIDACKKGTDARYINHSCEPNCYIDKWLVQGEYRLGIFAIDDIPAGTELTYDYKFESFGPLQKCLCGSKKCRGRSIRASIRPQKCYGC